MWLTFAGSLLYLSKILTCLNVKRRLCKIKCTDLYSNSLCVCLKRQILNKNRNYIMRDGRVRRKRLSTKCDFNAWLRHTHTHPLDYMCVCVSMCLTPDTYFVCESKCAYSMWVECGVVFCRDVAFFVASLICWFWAVVPLCCVLMVVFLILFW